MASVKNITAEGKPMLLAAKERFDGANHDTEHGETEDPVLDPLPRRADDAGTQPGFGVR